MSYTIRWIMAGALMLAAIAFGARVGASIWDECREAGHSALYCVRMVAR